MNKILKLVIPLLLTSAAHAAPDLSLDQATREIQQETGARVLSAEHRRRKGRTWYRFKLLTPKGRVQQVWVDPARTGHSGKPGRQR
jgi:uncharacterized membrane protein YkoI